MSNKMYKALGVAPEVFRDLKGFPNYKISNYGKVLSLARLGRNGKPVGGRVLKTAKTYTLYVEGIDNPYRIDGVHAVIDTFGKPPLTAQYNMPESRTVMGEQLKYQELLEEYYEKTLCV